MAGDISGLLAGCIDGDGPSWEAFRARYGAFMEGIAGRTLARFGRGNAERHLEDALAEAWMALLRKGCRSLRAYDPAWPFEPWLATIVRRSALQVLRREGLQREALRRVEPRPASVDAPPPLEDREAVERLLDRLPARERIAVTAFYLDGKDTGEIARALRVPVSTVTTLLWRGRAHARGGGASGAGRKGEDE